jgi:hypothetical protein
VAYQPKLSNFARHQLNQLPTSIVDTLLDCINEICEDPYRDPHVRVTRVVPHYRIFPGAYLYGLRAIAYTVLEDAGEVAVEAFGDTFY